MTVDLLCSFTKRRKYQWCMILINSFYCKILRLEILHSDSILFKSYKKGLKSLYKALNLLQVFLFYPNVMKLKCQNLNYQII